MKFFKRNLVSVLSSFLLFWISFLPAVTFATGEDPVTSTKITNPINVETINGLIKIILVGVIKIGIPIIALALIYSGFLFVAARGKPEELKTAKNAFTYTLIGAAILLASWAIAQLISKTVLQL